MTTPPRHRAQGTWHLAVATAGLGQGQVSGLPGVEHAPNRPISRGLELAEVSLFGGGKGLAAHEGTPSAPSSERCQPTPDIAAEAQQLRDWQQVQRCTYVAVPSLHHVNKHFDALMSPGGALVQQVHVHTYTTGFIPRTLGAVGTCTEQSSYRH